MKPYHSNCPLIGRQTVERYAVLDARLAQTRPPLGYHKFQREPLDDGERVMDVSQFLEGKELVELVVAVGGLVLELHGVHDEFGGVVLVQGGDVNLCAKKKEKHVTYLTLSTRLKFNHTTKKVLAKFSKKIQNHFHKPLS